MTVNRTLRMTKPPNLDEAGAKFFKKSSKSDRWQRKIAHSLERAGRLPAHRPRDVFRRRAPLAEHVAASLAGAKIAVARRNGLRSVIPLVGLCRELRPDRLYARYAQFHCSALPASPRGSHSRGRSGPALSPAIVATALGQSCRLPC